MIPRTVPERRWGDKKRVDDEDAARERLLDAAEECFSQFGASKTSIEDVARQAKVSRSTVYRYFEGRNELLAAAYMRENAAVFDRVKMLMAEQGTFAERVVRVTVRAINALRSGRYFPMLFNSDGALMSSQAIIASKMFYEAGHATMQPFFEEAQSRGEVSGGSRPRGLHRVAPAVDLLVRDVRQPDPTRSGKPHPSARDVYRAALVARLTLWRRRRG